MDTLRTAWVAGLATRGIDQLTPSEIWGLRILASGSDADTPRANDAARVLLDGTAPVRVLPSGDTVRAYRAGEWS